MMISLSISLTGGGNGPRIPAGFTYLRSAIDGAILTSATTGQRLYSSVRYTSAVDGSLLLSAIDNRPLYPAIGV